MQLSVHQPDLEKVGVDNMPSIKDELTVNVMNRHSSTMLRFSFRC